MSHPSSFPAVDPVATCAVSAAAPDVPIAVLDLLADRSAIAGTASAVLPPAGLAAWLAPRFDEVADELAAELAAVADAATACLTAPTGASVQAVLLALDDLSVVALPVPTATGPDAAHALEVLAAPPAVVSPRAPAATDWFANLPWAARA